MIFFLSGFFITSDKTTLKEFYDKSVNIRFYCEAFIKSDFSDFIQVILNTCIHYIMALYIVYNVIKNKKNEYIWCVFC
jgi:hypothetical protein